MAPGSERTPQEVLTAARKKINFRDIGIADVKIRFTVTGGILIEISGKDSTAKADDLTIRLREIFPENEDVRVTRPVKRTKVRISGLDVSVLTAEIVVAVASVGGCTKEEIKIGDIKKRSPRGQGAVWVQYPTTVAKKTDAGKITIGWVAARVEALKPRPMTCFKCMEKGHAARNCTTNKDRSNLCYNCGEQGHRARECTAPSKFPVCSDAGKLADHRFGGKACNPPVIRRRHRATGTEGAARETVPTGITEATRGSTENQAVGLHSTHESGREEAMETGE